MKLGIENLTELHLMDKKGEMLTVANCHNALWAAYLLAAVRLAELYIEWMGWGEGMPKTKCFSSYKNAAELILGFADARARMEGE